MALPPALGPVVARPGETVLVVDFDGSLAEIVEDPATARPLPAARDSLARLVPLLGSVAIVSGRTVGFLAAALPIPGLTLVGLYGLERLVDGIVVEDPRAGPFVDAVAAAARDARAQLPGLLVEAKGRAAVTVHWRGAPQRDVEASTVAAAIARRHGLVAYPGRRAVELRAPLPVDKGTVLEELVGAGRARIGVFAGDDAADLPAFAALRRLAASGVLDHGVRIAVRSVEAPPGLLDADVSVDGPAELAALFDELAGAISGRG